VKLTTWMVAALAALSLIAGCGDDDDDDGASKPPATTEQTPTATTQPAEPPEAQAAEQVVKDYLAAQVALDGEEACSYLTPKFRKEVPELLAPALEKKPKSCEAGFDEFAKTGIIVQGRQINLPEKVQELEFDSEVDPSGEKATVTPKGDPQSFQLVMDGGDGKVDDVTFE
jgi:hypothetical protein